MKPTTQTIGLYYSLSGLNRFAFNFMITTYAIYMMEKGLNLESLGILNSLYYTTVILMEIPTGAVADVFGRRQSFILAAALYGSAMFIYCYAKTFTGFATAEIFAALGATLWSGSFQAWLVDRLNYQNYQKPVVRLFARVSQIELIAGIGGSLGGAYLAKYSQQTVWQVSGALFIICGLIAAITMKEEYFKRQQVVLQKSLQDYFHVVKNSVKISLKNRDVYFLLVLGLFLWFAEQGPNLQWAPYFKPHLASKTQLGWINSGLDLATLVGAQLAIPLVKLVKDDKRAILLTALLVAVGIAFSAITHSFPVVLSCFFLFKIMRGAIRPLNDNIINKAIPSRERTTILSLTNLVFNLGGWLGLIVSGFLAERISISYAWLFSGAILGTATIWLLRPRSTAING